MLIIAHARKKKFLDVAILIKAKTTLMRLIEYMKEGWAKMVMLKPSIIRGIVSSFTMIYKHDRDMNVVTAHNSNDLQGLERDSEQFLTFVPFMIDNAKLTGPEKRRL